MNALQSLRRFAFLSLVGAACLSGENLLKNPGFEEGLSGWQKTESRGAEVTWSLDTKTIHGGGSSLRVSNASPKSPNVFGTLWQSVPVEAGKTYRLRAWVRGQRASGVRFTVDKKWMVRKGPQDGSYDWQEISVVYKVPEGENTLDARLLCENLTEALWVDDLSLSEEEAPVRTQTSALSNAGLFKFLPVFHSASIKIDGNLSEWEGHAGMNLPASPDQMLVPGWRGSGDLSARVNLAWDENALYFAAMILDDTAVPMAGAGQFAGDGLQLGFGKGALYGPEYGVSAGATNPSLWCWQKGSGTLGVEALRAVVSRAGSETRYEVAIPWKGIFADGRPQGPVAFNFLINDNDGQGRRGWLEWMPGIGRSKDPAHFPKLLLIPAGKKTGLFLAGPDDALFRGDQGILTAWVWNRERLPSRFHLTLPVGPTSLDLPGASLARIEFTAPFERPGDVEKTASMRSEAGNEDARALVGVLDYSSNTLKASFGALQDRMPALEKRFAECEAARIPADRERVDLSVLRAFIPYGLEDISRGRLPRAAYVLADLTRRYGKTLDAVEALLAGMRAPRPVLRYGGGPMALSNGHVWAELVDEKGMRTKGPAQMLGYGHFGQARRDIPNFQDFGHNIIQQEIGPRSTVFPSKDASPFVVDTKALDESIVPMLHHAASNRIAVILLLSPHYFPKWALDKWPELANPESGNFLTVIPDAPRAKAVLEAHLTAVAQKVRGLPALHSLCLANEPELIDTRKSAFSQEHWKTWIAARHGRIETLNRRWGTAYASFDEVPMQDPAKPAATPAFYDHTVWNAERFAAWHRWMAEVVHRVAPEIPVHVKIMQNIFERGDRMGRGVDPEAFCRLSDYAGCDAWLWPGEENWGRNQFAFYDLLHSIKGMPVVNSEDHYILDRDAIYAPDRARHVSSALFMGAFHHREVSTAWVWERTYDPRHDFEGSVLHRPDVVAEAGLMSLELSTQAKRIAAFNDAQAKVAILYSWPSLVYAPFYAATLKTVYDALRQNGQKVRFLTEIQLAAQKGADVPVLILPECSHVGAGVLEALEAYKARGGKLIPFGSGVLSRDEWNQALPEGKRAALLVGNHAFPSVADFHGMRRELDSYFESLGLSEASLKDQATGQSVGEVEFRAVTFEGKTCLVANNFGASPKSVVVSIRGKEARAFVDLLHGAELPSGALRLEPLRPVFVELK